MARRGNELAVPSSQPLEEIQPWDRQDGEDPEWHRKFLFFLWLQPRERTLHLAYQEWAYDTRLYIRGEPVPKQKASAWMQYATNNRWFIRAKLFDAHNVALFQHRLEEERNKEIEVAVQSHMEGFKLFQQLAIQSIVECDENGQPIYDPETNRPKLKKTESLMEAARIFEKAVKGQRTGLGMPSDLLGLSEWDLRNRIQAIQQQLAQVESGEILEGEVTDVTIPDDTESDSEEEAHESTG